MQTDAYNNGFVEYGELGMAKTDEDETPKTKHFHSQCGCCLWIYQRYLVAVLSSLGFVILFGIRCNLGVAIVEMTSEPLYNHNGSSNLTIRLLYLPEFAWTSETIGLVDSSFFCGYLITQIPGGYLASKLPANRIFGLAIGVSAFLNLLLPAAATVHYGLVMAVRILQGIVEGVTYPACHGIWRHWAPPLERSKLATISFCGSYAGAVLGMPLSGILTRHLGWPSGFYVFGAMGLLWSVMFWLFSFEKPTKNPYITKEELIYIETAKHEDTPLSEKAMPTPWLHFFTSMPVYAIIVANFCRSWAFYLLIVSQPMYFSEVFHDNVDRSGMLLALPHLVMAIVAPIGGQLADNLRKRLLTTTTVRKVFNCGGFGLEACFLLGVAFARDKTLAVVCLTLGVGFSGFAISGFHVNHLDIAPRFASILMGLSNAIGTLAPVICPMLTELITEDATADEWQNVFIIASVVHFLGIIFYGIFASGEQQRWAEPHDEDTWKPEDTLKTDTTGKFFTYGAFQENFSDQITHSDCYKKNDQSKNGLFLRYCQNISKGPTYETKEEFVQIQSKDKYLNGEWNLSEYISSS